MFASLPVFLLLAADSSAPVRVGYGEARPYCYTGPDGRPAGFLIDVFNEAARRDGMRIEWARGALSSEENTRALVDGRLDMLPLAIASAERKHLLFITEPWWSEPTILLVRGDSRNADLTNPPRLALPQALVPGADGHYRSSQRIVTGSAASALERVCRNAADAALLGATYIRDLVNARPDACVSTPLRITDSPVSVDFSIIAGRNQEDAAKRLRRRVTEMTADGALAAVAAHHPPISSPHAARMTEQLRARFHNQRLTTLLISAAAFLAIGLLALVRLILSRRKLHGIIEQQRRTEQELRESQAELKRRTADLVRSNEDLQAFAYSVSHDLQEPVRNQALYSELLQRKYAPALPAEAASFLQVIRGSALRTQEMMRSVLRYSQAGQSDDEMSPVDCTALVARVVEGLRTSLTEAGARVDVSPLPVVWGWEERLEQVFQNLIENAVKYRRADVAALIQVAAQQSGEEWRFSVRDNGIGFSQEYAERIFGLFKRLHGPGRYSGSGIGLALCRRIVERHGGRMWAESREGEGSTFWFTLPVGELTPLSRNLSD